MVNTKNPIGSIRFPFSKKSDIPVVVVSIISQFLTLPILPRYYGASRFLWRNIDVVQPFADQAQLVIGQVVFVRAAGAEPVNPAPRHSTPTARTSRTRGSARVADRIAYKPTDIDSYGIS